MGEGRGARRNGGRGNQLSFLEEYTTYNICLINLGGVLVNESLALSRLLCTFINRVSLWRKARKQRLPGTGNVYIAVGPKM